MQNPSHTYTSSGQYTVALTAYNQYGNNTCTKSNYITVASGSPPTASFSGTPTTGAAPLSVSFTDSSTGSPTAWSWTFGDGGTSTVQSPSHSYTSAGTYTVALKATNANGNNTCTKEDYISVTATRSADRSTGARWIVGAAGTTLRFGDAADGCGGQDGSYYVRTQHRRKRTLALDPGHSYAGSLLPR